MGWTCSSLVQFPSSRMPEDQTSPHLKEMGCSSPVLLLSVKDPPFCQFTSQSYDHHHRNLTLSGIYIATSCFLKHIPPQNHLKWHHCELLLPPTAEKSNKAKTDTDEILVLFCEGGETSPVKAEFNILTSSPSSWIPPHKRTHKGAVWVDTRTMPVHFDSLMVKREESPVLESWLSSSLLTFSHRQNISFKATHHAR